MCCFPLLQKQLSTLSLLVTLSLLSHSSVSLFPSTALMSWDLPFPRVMDPCLKETAHCDGIFLSHFLVVDLSSFFFIWMPKEPSFFLRSLWFFVQYIHQRLCVTVWWIVVLLLILISSKRKFLLFWSFIFLNLGSDVASFPPRRNINYFSRLNS